MDFTEQNNHKVRKLLSGGITALCCLCAFLVIVPLGLVTYHLIVKGISAINADFFTELPAPVGIEGGGLGNAIVGSATLLAIALAIAVPIGVLGGVFLAEYAGPKTAWWLRLASDVLNGVPSIIWGIVVYGLVVLTMRSFSAWAGGIALGFLMIPIIVRITEEVLLLVPRSYREAALALGIPKWKTTVFIVMRAAMSGIVTGVLLASARAAGETAPLLFTAFGNMNWNRGLDEPIAALPLQIFTFAISPYDEWHRMAWAGALVLLTFVFVINLSVRLVLRGSPIKS